MRALVFSAFIAGCSSQHPSDPPPTLAARAPASPHAPASPPAPAPVPVPAPELPATPFLTTLTTSDPAAAALVRDLQTRFNVTTDVEPAQIMDGGYRGRIRLEPALPTGANRKHLEWIALAMNDFDAFFRALESRGASPEKHYRFKPLALHFTRSIAARTPSAYAYDWTVAWNVAGSLHTSPDAVRETLFHEIFHLNDGDWSIGALSASFDAVVEKCGTSIPCLAPYSPNDTIVRGGTYYSFQPGNGVREYGAELALRYYREQRAIFRGLPRVKAFKCGPAENARAWEAMRDRFFGGVDAAPSCATSP